MAYQQPGYPPYGAPPQGHSPQPPYGQQYPPPQQQPYGAPPNQYPPQAYQQGYGGSPPVQQPYGAPPQPQGYGQHTPRPPSGPPPGHYPPHGHHQPPPGPPPQGYGQPPSGPSPQGYGQPPYGAPQYPAQQGYGAPQAYVQPTPPSLGYGPPQQIAWDGRADAEALRKAMKGFGTDQDALIRVLADKDPLQVHVLSETYHRLFNRNLLNDIQSETSHWFEKGLLAIVRGPLLQDVVLLHEATAGLGTKERVLDDVLLGRSNADLRAIKDLYQRTYHQSLEHVIKSELSFKTERHFLMVLAANRNEESSPVIPQQIDQDVMEIYKATEGKVGTDELLVCQILTQRSDSQIRAIAYTYKQKFTRDLEDVIRREFSGHMEHALIYQLRTGTDRAMRDAIGLEEAMAGLGTKDHLLVNRVVRIHWDRNHLQQVKGAYQHKYHQGLGHRIRGETSGHYEKLMLACIGE